MLRELEPELMEDPVQVKAYADADFARAHHDFIARIQQKITAENTHGWALDLGCGPGDVTCRFAKAFPDCTIDAVDGSVTMLDYAHKILPNKLEGQVFYHLKRLPCSLPRLGYPTIFSNSLLHHLPDPQVLWMTIKQNSASGSFVFVMDLLRPDSKIQAADLVKQYACTEAEILQRDFYHSLLAAFTIAEIEQQLQQAELAFNVEQTSDRHVFISGQLKN